MKLAETCVKYPVFTVMLIAFLVTLCVFSYRGLAVDLFPKADPATVNVEVRLPGATPEEVVTGVVLPLEDAISSVSGIDEINVYSFEGFADITCTFVLERDIEGTAQDIREKVAGPMELGLRTLGRVTSAEQFGEIVIGTRGGTPVRVRDVAQVEDGAQELRTWSALFRKYSPSEDVVSIQVLRQSGVNTVRVADDVRRKVQELGWQLPPGVQLQIVHDISDFIKASVHSLLEHLVLGSVLASFIVWIFIRNWRAVLIAAIAIPASVISTFTLMRAMDFSLNNMTLLALTLAVGIVIDDAIIVLENIFRYMEEKGRDRIRASIEATKEIGLAVMATTLSLVIIFLPIAFMTGYARKYVNSFGWRS